MVENVQIINKNGDGMFTEGIAYIEIISTGKKYLFYTLNERVDNDLTKLYIAESSNVQGEAKPIDQESWDDIKKKMVKISHKENVEDVKFLNMKNEIFNVAEAKKLAVTAVAKQAFKDAQITNTMSIDRSEESAMPTNTAFFNSNVVGSTNTEGNLNTDNSNSVFANPPQPTQEVEEAAADTTEASSMVQQVIVEESAMPGEQGETIVVGQNVQDAGVPNVFGGVEPVSVEQPVVDNPMVTQETTMPVETTQVEQQIIENPVVETTEQIERLITDDEAMQAIEIIQAFIDQEGGSN